MAEMEILEGETSRSQLILYLNRLYRIRSTKRTSKGEVKYLTCRDTECRVPATIRDEKITVSNKKHICIVGDELINSLKLKNELRRLAREVPTPPRMLYKNIAARYPTSRITPESARGIIERARKGALPKNDVRSLEEVNNELLNAGRLNELPTDPPTPWYRGMRVVREQKVLAFIPDMGFTSDYYPLKSLMMDWAFKIVPEEIVDCKQLVTIHTLIDSNAFAIGHFLVSGRTEIIYTTIFNMMGEIYGEENIQPTYIVADFEAGIRAAIARKWPQATHVGCYYLYSNAIYDHARSFPGILDSEDKREVIRKLCQVALLPTNVIAEAVNIIIGQAPADMPGHFFEYYQNFWMDTIGPERFSVCDSPARTNNFSESHHNILKQQLGVNPGTWHFIEELKKLANSELREVAMFNRGHKVGRCRRRCNVRMNQILTRAIKKFLQASDNDLKARLMTFFKRSSPIVRDIERFYITDEVNEEEVNVVQKVEKADSPPLFTEDIILQN